MTKKKQYKKQLPAAMPPKPRRAPAPRPESRQEDEREVEGEVEREAGTPAAASLLPVQAPGPELEQVRQAIRQLVSELDGETPPDAAPAPDAAPQAPTRKTPPTTPAAPTAQAAPTARAAGPARAPTLASKLAASRTAPIKPAARKPVASKPVASTTAPSKPAATKPSASKPAPPAVRPAPPRPPSPSAEPDRASGRKVAGLVLLALLSAAVGGGVVAWLLGRGDEATPTDTPTAQLPSGWPEAGASRTLTRVEAGGVLEVTHWIHTDEPLDQVDVSLPESGEGSAVAATDVRVTADGEPASGPTEITFSRATYVFDSATLIRVTYELKGAVQRSTSAVGRGLATTTSLDVSATQPRDVRVIRSAAVLSLSCAATAAAELAPCGEAEGTGEWKVQLTGTSAGGRVVAAVTVPS
ncbi:hypothetical protein SAMN04489844_4214 [Nocardioides exalbidus]|uniref:Uncharacterized protein n=1 Tax=Nocardioides exalbidus TaxID=402596 RepID=A0A1H4ZX94_9ACTN|nr:hypothetical protein [Nocardioides exalbidus]SED34101.1 hypothetical protein SAMN04489844_4214 [Nocardioides exalbidus]